MAVQLLFKRLGTAAMLVFLATNRRALQVPPAELYALVMALGGNELTEARAAAWLRERLG